MILPFALGENGKAAIVLGAAALVLIFSTIM